MSSCDLCGSMKSLVPALIEGTTLQVCAACARHGKVLPKPVSVFQQPKTQLSRARAEAEIDEIIVEDYSKLIKEAREKKGLSQQDLAAALKEKESVVQHIESGHLQPPLTVARKLEKFLHLILVQPYLAPSKQSSTTDGPLTIGDLIKIRKKN